MTGRSPFHPSSAASASAVSSSNPSNRHRSSRNSQRHGSGGRSSLRTSAMSEGTLASGASYDLSLLSTPASSVVMGNISTQESLGAFEQARLSSNIQNNEAGIGQRSADNEDSSASREHMQVQNQREQLRQHTLTCLNSSMPCTANAVMYGELLFACSSKLPSTYLDDALLYARALFSNHEYQRSLTILRSLDSHSAEEFSFVPNEEGRCFSSQHSLGTEGLTLEQLLEAALLSCRAWMSLNEYDKGKKCLDETTKRMIHVLSLVKVPESFAMGAENNTNQQQQNQKSQKSASSESQTWEELSIEEFPLAEEDLLSLGNRSFTSKSTTIHLHPALVRLTSFINAVVRDEMIGSAMIHPLSQMASLYGQVYDALNNPHKASSWLQAALLIDKRSMASFRILINRSLLTIDRQWELINASFDPPAHNDDVKKGPQASTTWLKHWYTVQLGTPETHKPASQNSCNSRPSSLIEKKELEAQKGFIDEKNRALTSLSSSHVGIPFWEAPTLLVNAAMRAYKFHGLSIAAALCAKTFALDPLCPFIAHVHIATLVGLKRKRELYYLSHQMVKADPQRGSSWFAAGCYYQLCQKFEVAQQHFCRATRLDPKCSEFWIGFGNSFAATDESDQALAAYRASQRCSSGNTATPWLYMGMEYLRTNHMTLAKHFLETAKAKSGLDGDPLACSELAVCSYQLGNFDDAIFWGMTALRTWEHVQERIKVLALLQRRGDWAGVVEGVHGFLADVTAIAPTVDRHPLCCVISCQDPYWEPAISNLGHSFLKTLNYKNAATCFKEALRLCPEISSTCVSLGLAYQLLGDDDNAISALHIALEVQPNHALANEMLKEAMKLSLARPFYRQFPEDFQGQYGSDEITHSSSNCDIVARARTQFSGENVEQDVSLSSDSPTRFFKNLHTPHSALRSPWHGTAGVSSSADDVECGIRMASMVGEIQDDMFSTHTGDQQHHSNLSCDSEDDVDMS